MTESQDTDTVLMIRPAAFGFDAESAASNAFQTVPQGMRRAEVLARAVAEIDAFAATLRRHGVRVLVEADTSQPETPDAAFPNNWLSLHADGTAVLYPMQPTRRRHEVRPDLVRRLADHHGFRVERVLDLTPLADAGEFLEGTGSLVLDRTNRIGYAALSPRTHREAAERWCIEMGYELIAFATRGPDGQPVYHTNVAIAVGPGWALACLDVITEIADRERVVARLRDTGHDVIDLDMTALRAFAGNALALHGTRGPLVALSARAHHALAPSQRLRLERYGALVSSPLRTIENVGGGSARCLLCEVHLPRPRAADRTP